MADNETNWEEQQNTLREAIEMMTEDEHIRLTAEAHSALLLAHGAMTRLTTFASTHNLDLADHSKPDSMILDYIEVLELHALLSRILDLPSRTA